MSGRFFKAIVQLACLALVLASLQTPPAIQAAAHGHPSSAQEASNFTLGGKITQVESGKFTINTEDNILFHVRYDDKTEIRRADGSDGSAKDLRVGVRVLVKGDLEESGEIAAAKIALQGDDSQKP
jgi:Domain of unknown function (DUF5666)